MTMEKVAKKCGEPYEPVMDIVCKSTSCGTDYLSNVNQMNTVIV